MFKSFSCLDFASIDTEMGKFQASDITSVIEEGQLGPNDITNLFGSLGLKQAFMERKQNAERSNVQIQAKNVLRGWIKKKIPTIGDLLKALENAGNKLASDELQEEWGISQKSGKVNVKYQPNHVLLHVRQLSQDLTEHHKKFHCRGYSNFLYGINSIAACYWLVFQNTQ